MDRRASPATVHGVPKRLKWLTPSLNPGYDFFYQSPLNRSAERRNQKRKSSEDQVGGSSRGSRLGNPWRVRKQAHALQRWLEPSLSRRRNQEWAFHVEIPQCQVKPLQDPSLGIWLFLLRPRAVGVSWDEERKEDGEKWDPVETCGEATTENFVILKK